jgi:hypothetical protein
LFIWIPGHCKILGNELANIESKKIATPESLKLKCDTIIDTKNIKSITQICDQITVHTKIQYQEK